MSVQAVKASVRKPSRGIQHHRTSKVAERILADSAPPQKQVSNEPLRCEGCGGDGRNTVWQNPPQYALWRDAVRTNNRWLCVQCLWLHV